jgi:small subunit ribosomal protein S6
LRNYELAYIADPDLDEQSLLSLEEKVKGWIQAAGGQVVKIDRWGKRRLSYAIRKRVEGFYTIVMAELPPRASQTVERDLRLNEQVLRYLITLQETA